MTTLAPEHTRPACASRRTAETPDRLMDLAAAACLARPRTRDDAVLLAKDYLAAALHADYWDRAWSVECDGPNWRRFTARTAVEGGEVALQLAGPWNGLAGADADRWCVAAVDDGRQVYRWCVAAVDDGRQVYRRVYVPLALLPRRLAQATAALQAEWDDARGM